MIARLRRRHRLVAVAMWLLPPAVWALSGLRPADPTMDALPASLRVGSPAADEIDWRVRRDGLELGRVVRGTSEGRWAIRASTALKRPDVLIYWLEEAPPPSGGVPDGALFVGRLDGVHPVALRLPRSGGGLLLFSLGHQERVAWLDLDGRLESGGGSGGTSDGDSGGARGTDGGDSR